MRDLTERRLGHPELKAEQQTPPESVRARLSMGLACCCSRTTAEASSLEHGDKVFGQGVPSPLEEIKRLLKISRALQARSVPSSQEKAKGLSGEPGQPEGKGQETYPGPGEVEGKAEPAMRKDDVCPGMKYISGWSLMEEARAATPNDLAMRNTKPDKHHCCWETAFKTQALAVDGFPNRPCQPSPFQEALHMSFQSLSDSVQEPM
ncbi:hypothetical protein H8958_019644 [Nasalis larvatus]